eukprot:XP_015578177.1 G-type lectin S-receptor-like serine/threonine-protein kinase At1g11330 [Ricinus communis]
MAICSCLLTIFLLLCYSMNSCAAIHTITSSQPVNDPETVDSPGNIFKLGFFSLGNSSNRYVGVWYSQVSPRNIVWVANRNRPLNDSSGTMTVSDGNLVILNGQQEILWSANVSNRVNNSRAHLKDDGNLVLLDNATGNIIWESFYEPCDTLLPNMMLSSNKLTGEKKVLTSWKSPSDPSIGSFSAGIDPNRIPQFFVWKESLPYWRSGPWFGHVYTGIPNLSSNYLNGFSIVEDNGTYSAILKIAESLYNFALDSAGEGGGKVWDQGKEIWNYIFKIPGKCGVYGKCGKFGVCNEEKSHICSCLPGFVPENGMEWERGNWTSGCVRRRSLQCDKTQNSSEVGKEDGFRKLQKLKVPDSAQWSPASEQQCKEECLSDCSCTAYSYYTNFGCMSWMGNLNDVQQFSSGGLDLYIRLHHSEFGNKRHMLVIISVTVVLGTIATAICTFFISKWIVKYKENGKSKQKFSPKTTEDLLTFSDVNIHIDNMSPEKLKELPVFSLQSLATATGNFDITNKLGEGGFGPVYRGKLTHGQEIAVKRLSIASGQGLQEFMNEVVVISKLQHRNLVRLLGCCVEGEEKMLVYEYMPNKSLDALLFDPHQKELLDWRKRFHIIEGICRGLLYLHRDSRLRIIHRDLKASNILLDDELNPKISDFGMARIFGSNEDQANTRRIVGTFGYISPEYVTEGVFSEKSDVFSFGVLLLEIVSGRKNSSVYKTNQALGLLGIAWKLWNEGNIAVLVDPVLQSDPCFQVEISRCVHVGLLCAQAHPKDRPAMSTVISMLNSEIVDLPIPKQPAFAESQVSLDSDTSQQSQKNCSVNIVTITIADGR